MTDGERILDTARPSLHPQFPPVVGGRVNNARLRSWARELGQRLPFLHENNKFRSPRHPSGVRVDSAFTLTDGASHHQIQKALLEV